MSTLLEATEWQKMEYERAFNVYCVFMAIKLHFTSPSFNYADYGPMTNYKFETFYAKEGPRKQFAKLARRFECSQSEVLENYIIANFIKNPKTWVTTLLTRQAQANYDEYRQLHENFSYNFTEKFEQLVVPQMKEHGVGFMEYLKGKTDQPGHTPMMTDIIRKVYPVWFIIAINKVTGFLKAYETQFAGDVFWESEAKMLKKIDQLVPEEDLDNLRKRLRELIISNEAA